MGNDGSISLTIWPAEPAAGRAIECRFDYHQSQLLPDGTTEQVGQIVITNRIVRRVIEYALEKHRYVPGEKGPILRLWRIDEHVSIADAVRGR